MIMRDLTFVSAVPEGVKEKEAERLFEEIMTENIPNLAKGTTFISKKLSKL